MRRLALVVIAAACGRELAIAAAALRSLPAATSSVTLPARLADREFWKLIIGPNIRYGAHAPPPFPTSTGNVASPHWGWPMNVNGARNQPTYAQLMTATDARGVPRGFLSSEEAFTFVKDLEARNLIVPVVGNFAGAKAIRAVGAYLKQKGVLVSAFYFSNVEEYLKRAGTWRDFCANLSALPLDDTSTFIRSIQSPLKDPFDGLVFQLGRMASIGQCR